MTITKTTTDIALYRRHFTDSRLWALLRKSAKAIGRTPVRMALILYYMYVDGLDLADKLLVLGALGYLILPLDMVADAIPMLGWTDDAAALTYVYKKLKDKATTEVMAKADAQIARWFD